MTTSEPPQALRSWHVDVVLVNWNGGQLLFDAVKSVIDTEEFREHRVSITVVDNGSVDGSADRVASLEAVRLILNGSNLGFGRACNVGARGGAGDFILLLNPDTRVESGVICEAVRRLRDSERDGVGFCGVALVDDTGRVTRSCARLPDWRMFAVAALGLERIAPSRFRSHVMSEWDHASTARVDHVIGAFYLVKRSAFESIQGFDERFFVYLEDLDLSKRLADAGHSGLFVADVKAYHKGGGTSRGIIAMRLFYALRSRLQYARKHFGVFESIAVHVTTLFAEPLIRVSYLALRLDFRGVLQTAEAYARLYGDIMLAAARRFVLGRRTDRGQI